MGDFHNYRQLAIEILSIALDDICPKCLPNNKRIDDLDRLAISAVQRVCGKVYLGQATLVEERFDKDWTTLQDTYASKLSALEQFREKSKAEVLKGENTLKIDIKLEKAMETWDKRRKSFEKAIQSRERGFQTRVASQLGKKYTAAEVADLRVGLEESIAREIRKFEERRDLSIRKIQQARNSDRIYERLMEKDVIYDMRKQRLEKSFKRQEAIHNKKWEEEDLFGAALHWFAFDIDKVNFWCTVAGVPLQVCYEGVRERLSILNYVSPEIDDVYRKIRSGEINEYTVRQLDVDELDNSRYNGVHD